MRSFFLTENKGRHKKGVIGAFVPHIVKNKLEILLLKKIIIEKRKIYLVTISKNMYVL